MQTKCLFNVLPSMSYCFSFSETKWPNVPFVFKSQKPCERHKLRLVGLHCLKMCNIYLGLSKTTSKLKVIHSTTYSKEPFFLLKWSYLPYGLGIGGAKLQGLTHLPGVIALSPHQNASAERWWQHYPTAITAPFACSFGLLVAELNPSLPCHCM